MSNYTIQVDWSGKDALIDSDVNKVISGNDFDIEFTKIQEVVNGKADLAGSITQAFSATTAVAGTNTTQVATTAYTTAAILAATPTLAEVNALAYPVNSIYTTVGVYDATGIAALLGVGTWIAFAAGKALIGINPSDTDFDVVESSVGSEGTGGTKTHVLTEAEMPVHNHANGDYKHLLKVDGLQTPNGGDTSAGEPNVLNTGEIQSAGGGVAHNNLPPYITVYFWKRTV